MHPILRLHRSFWVTVILFVAVSRLPVAVCRGGDSRGSRAGDSRRRAVLEAKSSATTAPGPTSRTTPRTGVTSMVTLALLTAGERPDSPTIKKALEYLRGFEPSDLHSTYAISLQTMVFAAADPAKDELPDQSQRRMARGCPDQARRPPVLARFVELLRVEAGPARR